MFPCRIGVSLDATADRLAELSLVDSVPATSSYVARWMRVAQRLSPALFTVKRNIKGKSVSLTVKHRAPANPRTTILKNPCALEIPTLSCPEACQSDAAKSMITKAESQAKVATFPRREVEAVLRAELMAVAQAEADMNGFSLPAELSVAVVALVPMDSLVVVETLCSVEPVVGFSPNNATVRTGGYNSVQDALDHMVPRLERQWRKKQGEVV